MNERINGLWWKARIGYNNQNCDPEVLEKFAELIIRECLNQCYNRGMNDELYAGQLRAAEYIENYFGVKNG